jgi:Cft2 family RNA processing exonuclease
MRMTLYGAAGTVTGSKHMLEVNGTIIMPSFAVGRTQQMVFTLNQLAQAGDIPHLP